MQKREVTNRRLAASKKWIAKEIDKAGLYAEEVAAEMPTPEERIDKIDTNSVEWWKTVRQSAADRWRVARRRFFAFPADEQAKILAAWKSNGCPGDATYFGEFLTNWEATREARNAPISDAENDWLRYFEDWRDSQAIEPPRRRLALYDMLNRGLLEKRVSAENVIEYRAIAKPRVNLFESFDVA
jgi:hypothetical protein